MTEASCNVLVRHTTARIELLDSSLNSSSYQLSASTTASARQSSF